MCVIRKFFYLFFLCITAAVGFGFRHNRVSGAKRKNYTLAPYLYTTETSHNKRQSLPQVAKEILLNDVISFDVFDTLLLRPFDEPKAVFYLVGEELKCPGFYRYRVLAEKQARAKKEEETGSNEVTLLEIYQFLQRYFIVEPEYAARVEAKIELDLILAHPYTKQVYNMAKSMKKTVVATTDMYLSHDDIEKMLKKCGYEVDELLVSNEYGISKRKGGLYEILKKKYDGKKILHFGDNFDVDVASAQSNGISAIYLRNVANVAKNHRAYDLTALIGSGYRGVLNNRLCSGDFFANQYYEYGFSFAGFFVLGYCNYIHQKQVNEHIDKVLFLSRDGDILKKVYDKLYPECKTEYVYWSRAAATLLTTDKFRNEFLLRFVKYKISHNITLKRMCKAMGVPKMAEKLSEKGMSPDTILTKDIYEDVVAVLIENWDLIDEKRASSIKAAKQFYTEKIGDAKKVVLVDVGWAASGFSALRYLIEDDWKINCEVLGVVAGANYLHDQNIIEAPLANGKMDAYIFSQRLNRDIKTSHKVNHLYSVFIEMMLSSPTPSFTGFSFDENGEVAFSFDLPEVEGFGMISDIQRGIFDFVDDYTTAFEKYPFMCNISGSDAYAVCLFVISRIKYFRNLFADYPVNRAVGSLNHETSTLGELIKKEYVR